MNEKDVCGERRDAWREWQEGVFADLYGVLATGPAFAGALIDYDESPRPGHLFPFRGLGSPLPPSETESASDGGVVFFKCRTCYDGLASYLVTRRRVKQAPPNAG